MEVDRPGYQLALAIILLLAALTAQPAPADTLRILSQNMNRLFDDVDDGNDAAPVPAPVYRERVARAAEKFAADSSLPHLIALQEIENPRVLRHLADALYRRHALSYRPVMAAQPDGSPLRLGYLVHPRLTVTKTAQLFAERRLANDSGPLFSRPPLQLEACLAGRCVTVLNLHLRSMRGIDSAQHGDWVASKRHQQARAVATWIDAQQRADPAISLMVLGDFNALTPSDRHVDVAGIIRGDPDNAATRLDARDLVERDLVDLTRRIPPRRRYSYIYRRHRQQLDYLFASQALAPRLRDIRYHAIDFTFSDHAALSAGFRWD